ncbi:MAG: hypothetical protein ACU0BS_10800 [Hasllibacter sp.]
MRVRPGNAATADANLTLALRDGGSLSVRDLDFLLHYGDTGDVPHAGAAGVWLAEYGDMTIQAILDAPGPSDSLNGGSLSFFLDDQFAFSQDDFLLRDYDRVSKSMPYSILLRAADDLSTDRGDRAEGVFETVADGRMGASDDVVMTRQPDGTLRLEWSSSGGYGTFAEVISMTPASPAMRRPVILGSEPLLTADAAGLWSAEVGGVRVEMQAEGTPSGDLRLVALNFLEAPYTSGTQTTDWLNEVASKDGPHTFADVVLRRHEDDFRWDGRIDDRFGNPTGLTVQPHWDGRLRLEFGTGARGTHQFYLAPFAGPLTDVGAPPPPAPQAVSGWEGSWDSDRGAMILRDAGGGRIVGETAAGAEGRFYVEARLSPDGRAIRGAMGRSDAVTPKRIELVLTGDGFTGDFTGFGYPDAAAAYWTGTPAAAPVAAELPERTGGPDYFGELDPNDPEDAAWLAFRDGTPEVDGIVPAGTGTGGQDAAGQATGGQATGGQGTDGQQAAGTGGGGAEPGATSGAPSFAGTYDSAYDTVRLTVIEDRVVGEYDHYGDPALLEGRLSPDGTLIRGVYETPQGNSGTFEFALTEDGFQGGWQQAGSGYASAASGSWNGTISDASAPALRAGTRAFGGWFGALDPDADPRDAAWIGFADMPGAPASQGGGGGNGADTATGTGAPPLPAGHQVEACVPLRDTLALLARDGTDAELAMAFRIVATIGFEFAAANDADCERIGAVLVGLGLPHFADG